jgi:hypothetical protein
MRLRLVEISMTLLTLAALCLGGLATQAATAAGSAAPLPIWQRMLLGGDYAGYTPQKAPPPIGTLASAAKAAQGFFDDLKPGQASAAFRRDGFRESESENLTGPKKNYGAFSGVLQLATSADAARTESFFDFHSLQPCPHSCTVAIMQLQVPGIPGALGTERIRHVADSAKPGDQPFELDEVFFTSGTFSYILLSSGPPDKVDHGQFLAAAKRLYERVKGAPAA